MTKRSTRWQPNLVRQVRWYLDHYSEFGVPILSNERIEQIVSLVLSRLDPTVLQRPSQTNVAGILTFLKERHDARVGFAALGSNDGRKVMGMTHMPTATITLDDSLLDNHPAYRFVAAHEIGHWLLHQWQPLRFGSDGGEVPEIVDTEDDLFALRGENVRPEPMRHVERQANHFAACLVLPESTFIRALVEDQVDRGICQRVGEVWVNEANFAETRDIQDQLALRFGVSKSAVRVRLSYLDRLHDDDNLLGFRRGEWKQISDS